MFGGGITPGGDVIGTVDVRKAGRAPGGMWVARHLTRGGSVSLDSCELLRVFLKRRKALHIVLRELLSPGNRRTAAPRPHRAHPRCTYHHALATISHTPIHSSPRLPHTDPAAKHVTSWSRDIAKSVKHYPRRAWVGNAFAGTASAPLRLEDLVPITPVPPDRT